MDIPGRSSRPDDAGRQSVPPGIPDDARELDRDVAALGRERRAERRRQRAGTLLLSRRWQSYGLSGPLVGAILAVVSVFGALVVVLHPSYQAQSPARPLASPAVAVGAIGGLLPDGPIATPARSTTVRALDRPAVLVLVPVPCDCDPVVREVVDQALQVTRQVRLLSDHRQDPAGRAVAALRTGPARGLATSGVDSRGVLAATYHAAGVTVLFVAPDGVLLDVVRDVQPGRRLDAEVGHLQAREQNTG